MVHIVCTDKGLRTCVLAMSCIFSMISAFSSAGYKLGTSAVLRIMLMSSTNDSSLIWLSLNRNTVCLPSEPAFSSSLFRSSLHSVLV